MSSSSTTPKLPAIFQQHLSSKQQQQSKRSRLDVSAFESEDTNQKRQKTQEDSSSFVGSNDVNTTTAVVHNPESTASIAPSTDLSVPPPLEPIPIVDTDTTTAPVAPTAVVTPVLQPVVVERYVPWKELTKNKLASILTLSSKGKFKSGKGEVVWLSVNPKQLAVEFPGRKFELNLNRLSWIMPHGKFPLGATLNQNRNKWQMQIDIEGSLDEDMLAYKKWNLEVLDQVIIDFAEQHKLEWFPEVEPERLTRDWLTEKYYGDKKVGHYRKERPPKKTIKDGKEYIKKMGDCFKVAIPHGKVANPLDVIAFENADLTPTLFSVQNKVITKVADNLNSFKPTGKKLGQDNKMVDDGFHRSYGSLSVELRNIWFVGSNYNCSVEAFQVFEMPDRNNIVNARGVASDSSVAPNIPDNF